MKNKTKEAVVLVLCMVITLVVGCADYQNINDDGPTNLVTPAGDIGTVEPKKTEAGWILELTSILPADIEPNDRAYRQMVAMLTPVLKKALQWSIALLIIGGAVSLSLKTGITQTIGNTLAIAGSIGVGLALFLMKTITMLQNPVTTWIVTGIIVSLLLILLACLRDRGFQLPSLSSLRSRSPLQQKDKEQKHDGQHGEAHLPLIEEDGSPVIGETNDGQGDISG